MFFCVAHPETAQERCGSVQDELERFRIQCANTIFSKAFPIPQTADELMGSLQRIIPLADVLRNSPPKWEGVLRYGPTVIRYPQSKLDFASLIPEAKEAQKKRPITDMSFEEPEYIVLDEEYEDEMSPLAAKALQKQGKGVILQPSQLASRVFTENHVIWNPSWAGDSMEGLQGTLYYLGIPVFLNRRSIIYNPSNKTLWRPAVIVMEELVWDPDSQARVGEFARQWGIHTNNGISEFRK